MLLELIDAFEGKKPYVVWVVQQAHVVGEHSVCVLTTVQSVLLHRLSYLIANACLCAEPAPRITTKPDCLCTC